MLLVIAKPKALTVSIIIPVYNEENYLRACLDSVAAQRVMADEVIVVNNNSTDKSLEIAKSYKFVKVLSEEHQGIVFARNRGFNAARSDIIGRIDADSILAEDWVLRVKNAFKDEAISAISGPSRFYNRPLPSAAKLAHLIVYFGYSRLILKNNVLFGSNMAIRRTAWQRARSELCLNNDYHEDTDLAYHLKTHSKIKFVRQIENLAESRFSMLPLQAKLRYMGRWQRTLSHFSLKDNLLFFKWIKELKAMLKQ
ncbi:glycosyltransferase family 2 protein [Candidatus Parcubacteria bacterium]|nr:glycosyltransferase family 2 protein [Candidatus Parcubacteria bacterium]